MIFKGYPGQIHGNQASIKAAALKEKDRLFKALHIHPLFVKAQAEKGCRPDLEDCEKELKSVVNDRYHKTRLNRLPGYEDAFKADTSVEMVLLDDSYKYNARAGNKAATNVGKDENDIQDDTIFKDARKLYDSIKRRDMALTDVKGKTAKGKSLTQKNYVARHPARTTERRPNYCTTSTSALRVAS